jgi:hypothetical protein
MSPESDLDPIVDSFAWVEYFRAVRGVRFLE